MAFFTLLTIISFLLLEHRLDDRPAIEKNSSNKLFSICESVRHELPMLIVLYDIGPHGTNTQGQYLCVVGVAISYIYLSNIHEYWPNTRLT